MSTIVIDEAMLAEWLASGVARDLTDAELRSIYGSLRARDEHRGWLPEPDATMFVAYGAELARRALLARD